MSEMSILKEHEVHVELHVLLLFSMSERSILEEYGVHVELHLLLLFSISERSILEEYGVTVELHVPGRGEHQPEQDYRVPRYSRRLED